MKKKSLVLINNKKLVILLIIGIVMLSFSSIIVKLTDASGSIVAFYRILFSAVLLTPLFIKQTVDQKDKGLQGDNRKALIFPVLSGLANALDYAFAMMGMKITSVANATLLNNIAPLWVGLFIFLILKKELSRKYWLGMLLAFCGTFFVLGNNIFNDLNVGKGDLLALSSSVFYAAYFLLTQKGREYFSSTKYYCLMLYSSTFWLLLLNVVTGNQFFGYPTSVWVLFLISAVFCQLMGQFSIIGALGFIPANIVSTTLLFQPVVSAILAFFFLGEPMMPLQWIGGAVSLLGVYFVNTA